MPMGPGKYAEVCGLVMERTQAEGVLLAVVGGIKGHGFSVKGSPEFVVSLPRVLRETADEIEATLLRGEV